LLQTALDRDCSDLKVDFLFLLPQAEFVNVDTLWMVISWTVFGLIVGAIARLLVPGEQSIGILGTMLLGVVGSFVGGFIGALLFDGEIALSNPAGWIGGIIGAVIVLLAATQFTKKKVS